MNDLFSPKAAVGVHTAPRPSQHVSSLLRRVIPGAGNVAPGDPRPLTMQQPVNRQSCQLCFCQVKEVGTPPATCASTVPSRSRITPYRRIRWRSVRSASRCWSRLLMVSRLSTTRLPLHSARESLTNPFLV